MKKWHGFWLSLFYLAICTTALADTTPQSQKNPVKWIFMFSSPQAKVTHVSTNRYRLVIETPNQTHAFMLNDRPFYLIREIQESGINLWKNFTNSNYNPNKKRIATLIINNEPQEVFLSHYQLVGNNPQFDIESTNTTTLKLSTGTMILFVTASSKPLCNLINELRHKQ